MLLSCQSCSRWENAITLAVFSVSAHRQIRLSLHSAHDRSHLFHVLWCVPAYASLRLAQACACCITAVDAARRYEPHALAAQQRRQLTPRLLVTGCTLLLLAQLAMLSACMQVALAAADTAAAAAAAAAAATAAVAVHPGVVNIQTLTSYGSPLP